MFYIDNIDNENNLYGIADSDDGIIEYLDKNKLIDLENHGLKIHTWDSAKTIVTLSMNKNCNYRLWRKLVRDCSDSDVFEYLKSHSVYSITNKLNEYNTQLHLRRLCRCFDYSQTNSYYLIVLGLLNGFTLLLRIDSDYNCIVSVVEANLHFEKYPSCAGNFISRLYAKQGGTCDVVADELYILMYNEYNSLAYLINQYKLGSCNLIDDIITVDRILY